MLERKTRVVLLVLFLSVLFSCTKTQEPEFRAFRLIDNLDIKNVLLSPLAQVPGEMESRCVFFPQKSYSMRDLASGENPFGIKRKMKIEGAEINTLFAPPTSRFRFDLRVPGDASLEFGVGIVKEENSKKTLRKEEQREGVMFFIFLEFEGKRKMIFQKFCSPPRGQEAFVLSLHSLDLPHANEKITLTLETRGEENSFSFWFNPVVYNKEMNEQQNVILISVDTLRADHLGCYGYDRDTSPNADALSSDGVLFLNAYASSPWTLPSHISLLTSLNGVHHQVYQDDETMDPSITTLADILRENHFCSSAFTGGGFVSAAYGFSKGFDFYRDGVGGVFHPPEVAELLQSAVTDWIDQNKDKNFFLFLHTYQPHNPYASPFPYSTKFLREDAKWDHIDLIQHLGGRPGVFKELPEDERQNAIDLYDGEICYTDEMFLGPLLEKLKELGLYDKTMIVFTSDHGEEFYDHGGWGHGHSVYGESLKVPLVIKFPNSKFRGKKITNIVSLADVMPTILDALEIDFSGLTIDGKSLFPVIEGKEKGDREFLSDVGDNILNSRIPQKTAMNRGKEKLILNRDFREEDLSFFVSPPPRSESVELYNLDRDPLERKNTAEERASLVNTMIREIKILYSGAKKRTKTKLEPDEKLREQLKALGYIQ